MDEITISIFGSGKTEPEEPVFELAYQLGSLLAKAGFVIVNGGYGGTMTAAAKGARDAGGKVIGVTCSAFGQTGANPYISEVIVTHSLEERLDRLIQLGDAYIVLPGSTGTLLELAMVWELKNKGFLDKKKTLILLGKYWQPLVDLIDLEDPGSKKNLTLVSTPEEVIQYLLKTL